MPAVGETSFELKSTLPSIIQYNQLRGGPLEDPKLHLSIIQDYYDTQLNGVPDDAIRLRLIPFFARQAPSMAQVPSW
ncbi:hypothetical protein LUZ60_008948 [Juncus effusus]|nr:hypothetical protein LUZ60_008948 [Juncus effusus]